MSVLTFLNHRQGLKVIDHWQWMFQPDRLAPEPVSIERTPSMWSLSANVAGDPVHGTGPTCNIRKMGVNLSRESLT